MPPNNPPSRTAPRLRVADTKLRKAPPKSKPYKLAVGHGLYLEVMPNGAKFWRWKYRLHGKESRFTLGAYPQLGMKDARRQAEEARERVRQGINPARQRRLDRIQQAHEQRHSLECVALEWIETRDWEPVTRERRESLLQRTVFPFIGALPVRQITPAQVLDLLQRAARQNGPTVAAEIQRTLSGVFALAIATLRAETDPVHPVRGALATRQPRHKRPLKGSEIGSFLRALDDYRGSFQTVAACKLMWFTLCRPSEATGAAWSEFDLDAARWTIPAQRMKKRREQVVPLPRQAVALLRSLQPVTGHSRPVFPHRDDRCRPMTDAALRGLIGALGWQGRYSPHATRATGSTCLHGMGFPSDWIERQLAHVDRNSVRGTYNHADYLNDRAAMMQHWCDHLDALKHGADVIPFGRATAS